VFQRHTDVSLIPKGTQSLQCVFALVDNEKGGGGGGFFAQWKGF